MELTAHRPLERLVHHLVLLNTGLSSKTARDDRGSIMVAIACQIPDLDDRVWQGFLDQTLDLLCIHRHVQLYPNVCFRRQHGGRGDRRGSSILKAVCHDLEAPSM